MNVDSKIQAYTLIGSIPTFIVWAVGLMACLRYYSSRPIASLLTGAALLIAAATRIALPSLTTWVFVQFFRDVEAIETRVLMNSLVFAIPNAVTWAIVLWVIFGLREEPRTSWNGPPADWNQ